MHIEISDELFREVAAHHTDVSAFLEKAGRQALNASAGEKLIFDAEDVIRDFRSIRGMFGNTLQQTLAWRRSGLS